MEGGLTKREREVLKCIACGLSVRETGVELGISRNTTAVHVANLREKLGAKNLVHAVSLAFKRGILKWQGVDNG